MIDREAGLAPNGARAGTQRSRWGTEAAGAGPHGSSTADRRIRSMKRIAQIWWTALLAGWLCLAAAAQAAGPLATVTIADGPAALLREAARFDVAEGLRLQAGDIVETPAQGRLLRLEFADGAIVDLGPASRALIGPRPGGALARKNIRLYLLQGWLKYTGAAKPAAGPASSVLSPGLEFSETGVRQAVLAALPDGGMAFCEAGSLTLLDRRSNPPGSTALKAGQFAGRSGSDKPAVSSRPSGAFLQNVPRGFIDTLPSRIEMFRNKDVLPKGQADIAYADVAPWLSAEPALRAQFVTQWRTLARKAEFRAGLTDNLRSHPEWERVLFPERFQPKPGPSATPRP